MKIKSDLNGERRRKMDEIAVLIPCFNEEITVGKVVRDFKRALPQATVYVYDNNSTDKTVEKAKEAGAIVRYEYQQGKGNVVRRMFQEIEAQCYILVDADDTYPASEAAKMTERVLKYHADMVVGDRLSSTYFKVNKRRFHNSGNRFMRLAVQKLFGGKVRDVMTGYRALSYRFAKTIPVLSQNFEIETELTVYALENNLQVEEIAVAYKERPNGSQSKLSTIRDGISIIKKLLHMFCFYKPGKLWKIVVLVAVFIEIKNARVKKFSNIRENLLHISSGMQVLIALVLIENIHYKNKMDSEARLQNKKIYSEII